MEKWKIYELADLCDITSSKRIYANELVAAGVPFLKSKEIIEKVNGQAHSDLLFISEERYVQLVRQYGSITPGDILLTSRGTLGVPYMVKFSDKFHFADGNLTWFRNFNNLDSSFLKYFFISPNGKAELQKCVIGSSQLAYTISSLKKIKIPLPPLPIQRRIAGILSAYDDLIENNQRRIAILERMARALYREWFVHFRYPGHEGVPLVASPLGEIPQGWEVKAVSHIVKRIPVGKKYDQKTVNQNGTVPILDQGKSGVIGYCDDEPGVLASKSEPVIVFANHTCYQRLIHFPFSAIQNVLPFIPNPTQHRNIYWLHWATNGIVSFNDYKGHWPEFASKPLLVPSAQLCQLFGNFIEPISWQILNLENQTQNLRRTRDLLLPRLLAGQLDVGELDDA
jgi:type I restriction enzyme S subunit